MTTTLFSNPDPDRLALAVADATTCESADTDSAAPPEELTLVAHARSAEYRRCFMLGRIAARRALAEIGAATDALLRDADGLPLWPRGIVGSITHCARAQIAAAVVARADQRLSLGIDLEQTSRRLQHPLIKRMTHPSEQSWIGHDSQPGARQIMLFSAREALFKALWPILRRTMHAQEYRLEWHDSLPGFWAIAEPSIGLERSPIYIQIVDDLVLSLVVVEAET